MSVLKSATIKYKILSKLKKSNFLKIYIAKNFGGRRDKSKWESEEVLFHIKVSKDKKRRVGGIFRGLGAR